MTRPVLSRGGFVTIPRGTVFHLIAGRSEMVALVGQVVIAHTK